MNATIPSTTDPRTTEQSRRRQPNSSTFSLQRLIGLVSAVIVCFSLYDWLGRFGLAWGLGLVAIAVGWLLSNLRTMAVGIACTLFFPLFLAFGYWQFGTVQHSGGAYLQHLKWGSVTIPEQLDLHNSVNGGYPDALSDLNNGAWEADYFKYEKTSAGKYRLTFLGEDQKLGGVGINSDRTVVSQAQVVSRRLPFSQFFAGRPVAVLSIGLAIVVVVLTTESIVLPNRNTIRASHSVWNFLLEYSTLALLLGTVFTYVLLTFASAMR